VAGQLRPEKREGSSSETGGSGRVRCLALQKGHPGTTTAAWGLDHDFKTSFEALGVGPQGAAYEWSRHVSQVGGTGVVGNTIIEDREWSTSQLREG